VFDEAALVSDEAYHLARPFLKGVPGAEFLVLSTPYGKRGWFYDRWEKGGADWARVSVDAFQSGRFSLGELEKERREVGDWWFDQAYRLKFHDAVGAVFLERDIAAAFERGSGIKPLFSQGA
jgi:hypothetical protein